MSCEIGLSSAAFTYLIWDGSMLLCQLNATSMCVYLGGVGVAVSPTVNAAAKASWKHTVSLRGAGHCAVEDRGDRWFGQGGEHRWFVQGGEQANECERENELCATQMSFALHTDYGFLPVRARSELLGCHVSWCSRYWLPLTSSSCGCFTGDACSI